MVIINKHLLINMYLEYHLIVIFGSHLERKLTPESFIVCKHNISRDDEERIGVEMYSRKNTRLKTWEQFFSSFFWCNISTSCWEGVNCCNVNVDIFLSCW